MKGHNSVTLFFLQQGKVGQHTSGGRSLECSDGLELPLDCSLTIVSSRPHEVGALGVLVVVELLGP